MATLIVEEKPCTIVNLVNIMSKSSSFSALCSSWKKIARNLGIREENITKWRNDLHLNKIDLEDLLVDLLYTWKGMCGDDATLEALCQVLTDSNSKDIADKLDNEFAEVDKTDILATGEVSVQGHIIKISDIFPTTADLPPEIVKQFRKNHSMQILDKFQIPNRPTYYIRRSLSPRTILNPDVFKSASSDVFVLENLEWGDLDDKLFGSKVERSSTQTVRVTAKFILLDFERDYEQICKAVPIHTPVHLVRFDRGSFHWVRSRGSLTLIQEHVSSEQEVWGEEEFLEKRLSKFDNNPVCIADTPGMGKSLLLASIAQSVKKSCPDRIVLFLVLRELGKSADTWGQVTTIEFAAPVLEHMMMQSSKKFEIFLDGYDEVLANQLDSVKQFLLSLKKHKNTRIHVTTRPHMRNTLEDELGVLGYTILAFTPDNQIDFLTRFWWKCKESENQELDNSRLKSFANQCLLMLKKNMNKLERDIAGIPLQCAMLAEVYAYDAVKFSIRQNIGKFELTCKVETIFQMFQELIKKKMDRIKILSEDLKQQLLNAHVLEAVKLIFPEWVCRLTCIQNMIAVNSIQSGYSESESFLVKLYAVGLMEPCHQEAGVSPRFVHRTFAEFLVAEHLVKHLRCAPCSQLLLDVVLGELMTPSREHVFEFYRDRWDPSFYDHSSVSLKVKTSQFCTNVIAYFVNAHLEATGNNFRIESRRLIQNLDKMLSACCLNNYSNIFHLLSSLVLGEQVDPDAWADMVLLGARYSERNLMEKLVELIQVTLVELWFPKRDFYFPVTPLHVAVQRGSYSMTMYLVVDQIFFNIESLHCLLHSCVYQSTFNSDAIVKEKIEIIKFLVGKRKDVVHERLPRPRNKPPLLLRNVHVALIETLIQQGADVNALDSKGNTVLHIICTSRSNLQPAGYTKVFNQLQSSNFELWDKKNNFNESPLYMAVESIEVEHNVLDQYSQLNVDFNHVQKPYDYSVLFAAISAGRTASFINKLEQLGADVNYTNPMGQTALHIAADGRNYDVVRYLVTVRNFDVNHRDCEWSTSLQVALLDRRPELDKIQAFLIDNGAEVEDAEYKWRPTPLYHALSEGRGLSLNIVKKMVEKGLSLEHLALAFDPLVRHIYIKAEGKGSWFIDLFRYLFEHGGRIQNAAKKLKQYKQELAEAIVINDQLLEQLKVTTGNYEVVLNGIHSTTDLYNCIISGDIRLELVMLALLECNQLEAFEVIRRIVQFKKKTKV